MDIEDQQNQDGQERTSQGDLRAEYKMTETDVILAYCMFFDRNPESLERIEQLIGVRLFDFIEQIIRSGEFDTKRASTAHMPVTKVSSLNGQSQNRPLCNWVIARFPITSETAVVIRQNPNWTCIFLTTLSDPNFRSQFPSLLSDRDFQLGQMQIRYGEERLHLSAYPNRKLHEGSELPEVNPSGSERTFLERPQAVKSLQQQIDFWRRYNPEYMAGIGSGLSPDRLLSARNLKIRPDILDVEFDAIWSDVYFDTYEYYLRYPEVLYSKLDAVNHFLSVGDKESRNPSSRFNAIEYAQQIPGILAEGLGVFHHWVLYGYKEGRQTPPAATEQKLSAPDRLRSFMEAALQQSDATDSEGLLTACEAWFLDVRWRSLRAAAINGAWVGDSQLPQEERFINLELARTVSAETAYAMDTAWIVSKYFLGKVPLRQSIVVEPLIKSDTYSSKPYCPVSSIVSGFSIITPFFEHFDYFTICSASVEVARRELFKFDSSTKFEWILVNDDRCFSRDDLSRAVPSTLLPYIVIMDDIYGEGISLQTNRGIQESQYDWLLFLDCDDALMPDCLIVLTRYFKLGRRYISSSIIDIADDSHVLRFRRHDLPPYKQLASGLLSGHLKCIHKSLIQEMGGFDTAYDGVQDYEFALRVNPNEIMLIPDYLYFYRWHSRTQSTTKAVSQAQLTDSVQKTELSRRFCQPIRLPSSTNPTTDAACIIRTRANRPRTLIEAAESVFEASACMRPVVVVHGTEEQLGIAQCLLSNRFGKDKIDVILAANTLKSRGYPLNIGVAHALDTGANVVCFLDDDDVIFPSFFSHLITEVTQSNADIAYGRSTARDKDNLIEYAHPLAPPLLLTKQNFITTNAIAISKEALLATKSVTGSWFSEDMYYLEDWKFLQALLRSQLRWKAVDECVGEYRLGSDGNSVLRQSPIEFARCQAVCDYEGMRILSLLSKEQIRAYANFPQTLYAKLNPAQLNTIREILFQHG